MPHECNLEIPGYSFVKSGYSLQILNASVCLFTRMYNTSFQEYINLEPMIGNKTCNFTSLNRSPSQTKDDFENFIKNFEPNLRHIANTSTFLIVVLSDLDATSKNL